MQRHHVRVLQPLQQADLGDDVVGGAAVQPRPVYALEGQLAAVSAAHTPVHVGECSRAEPLLQLVAR